MPELLIAAKAVDEASAALKTLASNAEGSMGQIETSVQNVDKAQKNMDASMRGVVTGFSGVATSAMNLYNAFDRIEDMTVGVDRANLAVKTSLNSVEDAQRKYNATVEKYGADSEQAVAVAKDLELSQERYQVAVERADVLQGNLNETMVQSAISIIPTAITMIDSLVRIKQSWAAAQAALNVVMNANPIMLIVTAIGILIAAVTTAYLTCEPFRNAVNQVGATLMTIFKPAIDAIINGLSWLWNNVIMPLAGAFKQLWDVITNNPILALLFGPVTAIAYLFQHWEDVTKAVSDALDWLWHNIVEPFTNALKPLTDLLGGIVGWFGNLGNTASTAASQVNSMTNEMMDLYDTVGQPPSTGLIESFESLDKTMKNIKTPDIEVPETRRNLLSTSSAYTPSFVRIEIDSPLVNIEGSADRETARLAADLVEKKLRNVLVEASSGGAPATHKRIRTGGLINVV